MVLICRTLRRRFEQGTPSSIVWYWVRCSIQQHSSTPVSLKASAAISTKAFHSPFSGCWGLVLGVLLAALPLALALAWHFRKPEPEVEPRPEVEPEPEVEPVVAVPAVHSEPEKEEVTMWILFLLDPCGIRHAVEVMSTEWSTETIYAKALAATGIPIDDQILKFGGRCLKPGKKLTSYGVQHGSEIVIEARKGKLVETRQGKQSTGRRREISQTKGRQAI